jgi:glycogen phosphorylase
MKTQLPEFAHIPDEFSRFPELAYNLWWSWNSEARGLFQQLNPIAWQNGKNNAVTILKETSAGHFDKFARNSELLALYNKVINSFDSYMRADDTWFKKSHADISDKKFAYFSAEFGLHTSVPIYSGGLGILAGDTCKEASDLGLPFAAVGALYPEGYFKQEIEPDGTQKASYERIDLENTAILPILDDSGNKLLVPVPFGNREILVALWLLQAGRIPIYLMDTNISENSQWDRDMVARLYGGDNLVRLRQEIILGIGGAKVLEAVGHHADVIHLNEGHAAFAAIEFIRKYMDSGKTFEEALVKTREKLVFTTHTPVKAGHDQFPFHLIEEHFFPYWDNLDLTREQFLALGSQPDENMFGMTVLALKTAHSANGVSKRHGEVSRNMWNPLFPDKKEEDVPIDHITNGVHVPTWLTGRMSRLLDKHLAPGWLENHDQPEIWEGVRNIPDREFWDLHLGLKNKLFTFMETRAQKYWLQGGSPRKVIALQGLLKPEVLTIGFARRFATYKRATLIFSDLERLKSIILHAKKPVQIIISGKAHPADEPGKHFIRQVFEFCSSHEFGGQIAFIEDYNKEVAHHLIPGVDVWLNNPIPPLEASGTSGEKASLNGVPNFSVLDGWWSEGFNGKNGWAIEGNTDEETAESIYRLLEEEITETYYQTDFDGVPRQWVSLMKEAICSTAAAFSARRMVKEYLEKIYLS